MCRKIEANYPRHDTKNLVKLWIRFRDEWKRYARWTLFWWADTSDDVLARIEQQGTEEHDNSNFPLGIDRVIDKCL